MQHAVLLVAHFDGVSDMLRFIVVTLLTFDFYYTKSGSWMISNPFVRISAHVSSFQPQ